MMGMSDLGAIVIGLNNDSFGTGICNLAVPGAFLVGGQPAVNMGSALGTWKNGINML